MVTSIITHFELDASVEVRNNNIVHAAVGRSLRRPSRETKVIAQQDVGHDHLDRMIGKESPRADNFAVAKMQIVFACGCEL